MEQNVKYFSYIKSKRRVDNQHINGIPSTPQRQAVLQALAIRDDHPSADEIYQQARKLLHGLSRSAVYHTLETLVKSGMVKTIEVSPQKNEDPGDRARMLCIGCGQLHDLAETTLDDLVPWYLQTQGTQGQQHTFVFTGLCFHCTAHTKPGRNLTANSRPAPPSKNRK